jgi:hypothetical protein
MIFSGPLPPAVLGAAIASAKIHRSGDLHELQAQLQRRMRQANDLIQRFGLPLVAKDDVPIRFIALGLPKVAYNMGEKLSKEGFYFNVTTYPGVAMRKSGLRVTITCHQRLEDIEAMVEAVAYHLPRALEEEGSTIEEVRRDFGSRRGNRAAGTRHRGRCRASCSRRSIRSQRSLRQSGTSCSVEGARTRSAGSCFSSPRSEVTNQSRVTGPFTITRCATRSVSRC